LSISNKVRRGDIRHAVVVRARKEEQRKDGSLIRFDDNACVLINKNGDPIGSRLTSTHDLSWLRTGLTSLQASLEPNSEIDSGPRFCHWRPCMYEKVDNASKGRMHCSAALGINCLDRNHRHSKSPPTERPHRKSMMRLLLDNCENVVAP
jgi:hypothetical protein